MRLSDQYAHMHKFYHGQTPSHPPQIKLLADAHVNYLELYDEEEVLVKSKKKSKKNNQNFDQKDETEGHNMQQFTYFVLQWYWHLFFGFGKKENLNAMAIRGARAYKKALAYSKDKWDIETLEQNKKVNV